MTRKRGAARAGRPGGRCQDRDRPGRHRGQDAEDLGPRNTRRRDRRLPNGHLDRRQGRPEGRFGQGHQFPTVATGTVRSEGHGVCCSRRGTRHVGVRPAVDGAEGYGQETNAGSSSIISVSLAASFNSSSPDRVQPPCLSERPAGLPHTLARARAAGTYLAFLAFLAPAGLENRGITMASARRVDLGMCFEGPIQNGHCLYPPFEKSEISQFT